MSETWGQLTGRMDRRGFLGASAGAIAAGAALGDGPPAAAQDMPVPKTTQPAELPKRALGRTDASGHHPQPWHLAEPGGRPAAPLRLGQWRSLFDTAKSYGSEPMIARWLQAMPGPQGLFPGHQGPAEHARELIP